MIGSFVWEVFECYTAARRPTVQQLASVGRAMPFLFQSDLNSGNVNKETEEYLGFIIAK